AHTRLWAVHHLRIFGGEPLIFAAPHAVGNHRVGFGVPETTAQPGAGAFNWSEFSPQAANLRRVRIAVFTLHVSAAWHVSIAGIARLHRIERRTGLHFRRSALRCRRNRKVLSTLRATLRRKAQIGWQVFAGSEARYTLSGSNTRPQCCGHD